MIFKYELRFVAFTRPNLCLWVVILYTPQSGICKLKPKKTVKKELKKNKNLKISGKNLGFYQPCKQEAQLMLTTGSTRLAVSRGQQTWYHSICYI